MKKFLIGFIVFSLILLMLPAIVYACGVNVTFTKTVSPDTVIVGEEVELTYTFTVTNKRHTNLLRVKITDPDVGLDGSPGSGWIGCITPGESKEIVRTKTVIATVLGEMKNTATVTGKGKEGPFKLDATAIVNIVEPEPEPEPEPIIPTPEPIISEPKPCDCALVVQKRDEAGNAINGAVLKVDGIEKKTVNGDARWDNLECDTSYEVREISPIKQTKGIHLGSCGERSTMRIVNKVGEVTEPEILLLPETGQNLLFGPFLVLSGLIILRVLSGSKRKED